MRRAASCVFSLAFAALLTGSAAAAPLTEPGTGLTVDAPAGYTLSYRGGVYTLARGKQYAKFMLARSPFSLGDTATSFIKLSKIKSAKRSGKGSTIRVTGKLKKKPVTVQFRSVGSFIDIVMYGGPDSKKRRGRASARVSPRIQALTAGDIAQINAVLNTRAGGVTTPLQLQIPMQRFVAPDGGSSALVPALPGWTFAGGQGVMLGSNLSQGAFELGAPAIVSFPGFGGTFVSPFVGPDGAIFNVFPQYVAFFSGLQVQVLGVQQVPGTEGWLGPNFLSALYGMRFLVNGVPWQGLMASGVFDVGSSLGFGWYHSYIAVPENGPGGIAPALLQTWSSWDNSGASAQRLNQALQTLRSIRVQGAGPIDPDVFQAAANAWSEYIRQ